MLSFPIFDIPFDIHTDTSDYQLGGVLMKEKKLITLFYRKLTDNRKIFTTTEKELIIIVETLK